jgi:phage shock protein E
MSNNIILLGTLVMGLTACGNNTEVQGTAAPEAATTAQPVTTTEVVALDALGFRKELGLQNAVLVDVRTPEEFAAGHIAGSSNIDWNSTTGRDELLRLKKERGVLLYCASGNRSGEAAAYLAAQGYTVKHLAGGIGAWQAANFPLTR